MARQGFAPARVLARLTILVLTILVSLLVAGATHAVVIPGSPGSQSGRTHSPSSPAPAMSAKLMPESLRGMLRAGLSVRITSNVKADGIVAVLISRAEARRAHISASGPAVTIARGTMSGIKVGTVTLHLHLSRALTGKLRNLGALTLTLRFLLFASGGRPIAIDLAGRY